MTPIDEDPAPNRRLQVRTHLGESEVDADQVVTFPSGLPGFEQSHRFVLVSSDAVAPLRCLHALDGDTPSLLVIDPRIAVPDYRCALSGVDRHRLGATEDAALLWLTVVTLDSDGTAALNLRAPIVINPATMIGGQIIPHDTAYPLRHPLTID